MPKVAEAAILALIHYQCGVLLRFWIAADDEGFFAKLLLAPGALAKSLAQLGQVLLADAKRADGVRYGAHRANEFSLAERAIPALN